MAKGKMGKELHHSEARLSSMSKGEANGRAHEVVQVARGERRQVQRADVDVVQGLVVRDRQHGRPQVQVAAAEVVEGLGEGWSRTSAGSGRRSGPGS
eukprot:1099407-Heterocapsa_arctica.AAC.1